MKKVLDSLQYLSDLEKAKVEEMWPELFNPGDYKIRSVDYRGTEVVQIPRFRGFEPDLVFWLDPTNTTMMWNDQRLIPLDINLPRDGKMFWIQGKFFLDNHGNRVFKPKIHKDANVYLIKIEWGGPNSDTRGIEWEILRPLAWHAKRCVSNNGKQGINYYIFSTRFKYRCEENVDDLIHKMIEEEKNYVDER